jgi:hypothetical protein
MEAVAHKGKVYQLNALYALIDGSKVVLDGIREGRFKVSRLDCEGDWFTVNELFLTNSLLIGTIENAPLELEDGHCYYCEIDQHLPTSIEYATLFFFRDEWFWDSACNDECKDFPSQHIKPLHRMVKAND